MGPEPAGWEVTDWTDDDRETLHRLAERLERDPSFSKQETELIREMIAVYRGVRAWGRGARFFIIGLAGLAAAITAGETIFHRVMRWFGN